MKKHILIYGLALALFVTFLKVIEYRYFIRDLSVEIYVAVIAILFAAVGVWMGRKLSGKKQIEAPPLTENVELNLQLLEELNISRREYEVLELMAAGLSNQEIADKLFLSLNTVKKHSSSLFTKLDVKRRTQAIEKARKIAILPIAL